MIKLWLLDDNLFDEDDYYVLDVMEKEDLEDEWL
jgi:hypothetical protein